MDKKRLKIAFLSRYSGTVNRGVETYVFELSSRLKKDFEVEVLAGKDADSFKKMINGGYDVIVATNGRMQALKASVGRLFSGYKLVISGQAGIGKDDIWNLAIAAPNVYIALTSYEQNWAKKWALNSKVIKIPNGVDLDKFSPKSEKAKLDMKGEIVLSVGALFWYKHHERSIRAVAKLSGVNLMIIGSGPKEDALQKLGEELLGERFRILKVDFREIPKFYRSAKLFVLPSWIRESFGIAYIEALASNVPVVAPNDLSRREIIGDGGLYAHVEDIDDYAATIQKALDTDFGDRPRKQAEKFSWDKITDEYSKVFREIVK